MKVVAVRVTETETSYALYMYKYTHTVTPHWYIYIFGTWNNIFFALSHTVMPKITGHVSYKICLRANFPANCMGARQREGGSAEWEIRKKLCQSLHLLRAHSILNEWPARIFYLKLTIQFHLHFNGIMCQTRPDNFTYKETQCKRGIETGRGQFNGSVFRLAGQLNWILLGTTLTSLALKLHDIGNPSCFRKVSETLTLLSLPNIYPWSIIKMQSIFNTSFSLQRFREHNWIG